MGFNLGKAFKVSGSGSHSLGSMLGGGIGAAVGGYFGGTGGAAAGYSAGSSIGSMFGPSEERMAHRQYVYQYNKALQMWRMENEYNSPLQQMQRLKEAGLNPALVYGTGGVSNTSSGIDFGYHPTSSYTGSKQPYSKAVEEFFLKNQMNSAENQNEEQQLKNEYLRLRNQALALQIEKFGKGGIANKIRKDKPLTLTEAKAIKKIHEDSTKPRDVKGSSLWTALPVLLENLVYGITDKIGGAYYRGYNDPLEYNTTGELF